MSTKGEASAPTVSYNDNVNQEAELRQRLLEKAPPPFHGSRSVPYKSPFVLFGFELRPELLAKFEREEACSSISEKEQRIRDETKRRWDEVLSEEERNEYATRLNALKADTETKFQAHRQAKKAFRQQLKDLVNLTTVNNSIVVNRHAGADTTTTCEQSSFPPQTRRYPDHEFAITKSRIFINWVLANCLLLFIDHGSLPRAMVTETNIPGVIPHFVDSSWMGHDLVYASCPALKKKKVDSLPKDERELKWVATGYYKVYPPDDEYIVESTTTSNKNIFGHHSLPFRRSSIRQYFQLIRDDVALDATWSSQQWTKTSSIEPVFTAGSRAAGQAPVTAFRSQRGDRVEYWGRDTDAGASSYAILQTHQGRVVVVAVTESHPYVFCNLLEFFNSDGSADMPELLPSPNVVDGFSSSIDDDEAMAKKLIKNILKTAEDFLYNQLH